MGVDHDMYMKLALTVAETAGQSGEVPVGAVVVSDAGEVIARAGNETITRSDPTAHAEILALRAACSWMENYRLPGMTLYVTIEPCIMCMAAAVHARLRRIVYGAPDPKWGGAGSLYTLQTDRRLNHQPDVIGGVCETGCRSIIQSFFKARRQARNA
ncbi:MAG: tRNA-specific adenosine deaminase [Deltaproteobacteria bacterium]|nr:MAG: tRNA-specific adenosine deaminase [Deltaproteobacteria bacterium]